MKLIGGGFRVGVSRLLVTRALGEVAGVDAKLIAQRLMGWIDGRVRPSAERYAQLIAPQSDAEHQLRGGQPYPFFLAHALQTDPAATLGPIENWLVEWKYDGIRAQLVRRSGQSWLWSRGEDLITDRFPEISAVALPDGTVVDGEVLIWRDGVPALFAALQKRIGRKTLSGKMMQELPAALIAYDLLEQDGEDLRKLPQRERRQRLEALVAEAASPQLVLSPLVEAVDWEALATLREESRARGRGHDDQGRRRAVRRRPHARCRHLVEMEDRSVQRGRRADLCTGRPRPARIAVHRLYLCGLGRQPGRQPPAGAVRQGLFGVDGCRDRPRRCGDPPHHH
jgi:DNA ligase-1